MVEGKQPVKGSNKGVVSPATGESDNVEFPRQSIVKRIRSSVADYTGRFVTPSVSEYLRKAMAHGFSPGQQFCHCSPGTAAMSVLVCKISFASGCHIQSFETETPSRFWTMLLFECCCLCQDGFRPEPGLSTTRLRSMFDMAFPLPFQDCGEKEVGLRQIVWASSSY